MSSDEEGWAEAPEELSEVDMSELSDSISNTTAASTDDERQTGSGYRGKIEARAPAYSYSSESSCDNSSGPPSRALAYPYSSEGSCENSSEPAGREAAASKEDEDADFIQMSREAVKAWEEHRKALRAARRTGRTTYGEYLRAKYDRDLMSKRVIGRNQMGAH
jgi:hypothetical protein